MDGDTKDGIIYGVGTDSWKVKGGRPGQLEPFFWEEIDGNRILQNGSCRLLWKDLETKGSHPSFAMCCWAALFQALDSNGGLWNSLDADVPLVQ